MTDHLEIIGILAIFVVSIVKAVVIAQERHDVDRLSKAVEDLTALLRERPCIMEQAR